MPLRAIDTHAHVFERGLPLAPERRYAPSYDAPLETYLAVLDRHGVGHSVLVQPSFLGTDNSYLLRCVARAKGRVRGIAVVQPETGLNDLRALKMNGVAGLRFNLIGRQSWPLITAPEIDLAKRASTLNLMIEVQVLGALLVQALDLLDTLETPIVIDHFGLPDASRGLACPGFHALLNSPPNVFVKLSAPYRFGIKETAPYRDALLAQLGPHRLLWGSDWPWTQHEDGRDYVSLLKLVDDLPDAPLVHATAARLFGFSAS